MRMRCRFLCAVCDHDRPPAQTEPQLSIHSHDVVVAERISHSLAVMGLGEIVEIEPRDSVINPPQHGCADDEAGRSRPRPFHPGSGLGGFERQFPGVSARLVTQACPEADIEREGPGRDQDNAAAESGCAAIAPLTGEDLAAICSDRLSERLATMRGA